jgi:4-hydroxy-tetrahydrodipicolinate synthase
MLTGTYTAIITPMRHGKIDVPALRRLIERQIRGGVDGIVPVGTTGESPTLNYEEHIEVIARSVEFAAGKIKVMAGSGGNSTSEAIYLTVEARKAGADSTLQVAPYYNRPTQEGILYSIPSRCGVEIAVETVRRLAAATPRVVGIKEAGGNPDRVTQLRAALGHRFSIFSGDDSLTLPFMSLGAHGVISVASNIIPRQVAQLVRACAGGNYAGALKVYERYYPVFKDLFIETNPVPVKAAAAMLGQIDEEYRLPLVRMSATNRAILKSSLIQCGILKP